MSALGDDCYFFCTSSCAKGSACPFRHVETAKTCRIICQHWQLGGCMRPMCKFRHSDFIIQINPSEVSCYWESQPTGCVKKNCAYKHSKPRVLDDAAPTVTSVIAVPGDNSTVGTSKNEMLTAQGSDPPVTIQPTVESVENISSPRNKPPEMTAAVQDSTILKQQEKQETDLSTVNNNDSEISKPPYITQEKVKKKRKLKKSVNDETLSTSVNKKRKSSGNLAYNLPAKRNKSVGQPRRSIKERLGVVPFHQPTALPSSESSDSESSSDSDDSIKNIKVMSMEEIFRQKALESMMKKRAVEEKSAQAEGKTPRRKALTHTAEKNDNFVKKVKPVMMPLENSSSSSEDESSDEKDNSKPSIENSSSSSDSSSASSSTDNDEDDSDTEALDVRRVVVDMASEKAARKRAKASLMKKQKQLVADAQHSKKVSRTGASQVYQAQYGSLSLSGKREQQQRKRHVKVADDFDDIASARVKEPLKLNVRDRLGKSSSVHKASSDACLLSRKNKSRSFTDELKQLDTKRKDTSYKSVVKSSSSEEDNDPLAEVKIKTLEEIKQEKMRKLLSQETITGAQQMGPFEKRLGLPPDEKQNREAESVNGRQIMIMKDSDSKSDDDSKAKISDDHKKSRKRQWRRQKRNTDLLLENAINVDERRAVVKSPSVDKTDPRSKLSSFEEGHNIDESIFEQMRRRAFLKKMQLGDSKKLRKSVSLDEVDTEMKETSEMNLRKEHDADIKANKHKHKHHKRVKTERQIYVPPAIKNSAQLSERPSTPESLCLNKVPVVTQTVKVAPQKREPHPIAAAWAAGLTLSSRGAGVVRRPESLSTESSGMAKKLEIGERINTREVASKPKDILPVRVPQIPSESSEVVIKSFSEIMAEKRKRRLEMQAQKTGLSSETASTNSSPPAASQIISSPAKAVDAKPRVPISPIVFSSNQSSSSNTIVKTARQSSAKMPYTDTASSAIKATKHFDSVVNPILKSKEQLTVAKVHKVAMDDSSSTCDRVSLSAATNVTSSTTVQKVKKNSIDHEGKKKKLKKPSTPKTPLGQASKNSSKISEGISNNMPDSLTSVTPISLEAVTSVKTSTPHNNSSQHICTSKVSSQLHQDPATTKGMHASSPTDTSNLKTQIASSSKHKVASVNIEPEPVKKKAHFSMDDEFNFFEDEDLGDDDALIPVNIEPIDDLLQDIDNLLS